MESIKCRATGVCRPCFSLAQQTYLLARTSSWFLRRVCCCAYALEGFDAKPNRDPPASLCWGCSFARCYCVQNVQCNNTNHHEKTITNYSASSSLLNPSPSSSSPPLDSRSQSFILDRPRTPTYDSCSTSHPGAAPLPAAPAPCALPTAAFPLLPPACLSCLRKSALLSAAPLSATPLDDALLLAACCAFVTALNNCTTPLVATRNNARSCVSCWGSCPCRGTACAVWGVHGVCGVHGYRMLTRNVLLMMYMCRLLLY